ERKHRRVDRMRVNDRRHLGKTLVTSQMHKLFARWRTRSFDDLARHVDDHKVGERHLVVRNRRRGDDNGTIVEATGDVATGASGQTESQHVLRGSEDVVVHAHCVAPARLCVRTMDMNWSKSRVLSTTMSRYPAGAYVSTVDPSIAARISTAQSSA